MSDILAWISANKDWIFDGIGITVLIFIGASLKWIFSRNSNPPKPTDRRPEIKAEIQALGELEKANLTESIKWNRSANLFWLANDLCALYYVLRDNSGKSEILFFALQSLHHLNQLGFDDIKNIATGSKLKSLIENIKNTDEAKLTKSKRYALSLDVNSIIQSIGVISENKQLDFVPYHEDNVPYNSANFEEK
jgi:hypothetical protein